MSERPVLHLRDRAVKALKDDQMRQAVRKAVDRLSGNKDKAARELPNWEEWREQTRLIRQHTISHLDYYLKTLTENVRKAGGQVHFALTAEEARKIITALCKQYQAKQIVKSKSMVTEEIHLNPALTAAGMEVVESDLAEYILQLAGETPSHIIVPAIHKNRYQIAELFSQVAGEQVEPETPALTAFARKVLRGKFMSADIGITGCNFAVAETGSITLVTNEGNARLTTALPNVVISVMGMERIVPTFEDLETVLSMLPRNATGQKLTSYVSVINGPRRPGDIDGCEKFHVVIVDNGRSRMLADEEYRQALHCIRCGACFNVCPVYRQIGGHAYGSVYGGPIGSVITPLLENDFEFWGELPYASTLCAACTSVCPAKIPLQDLLFKLRQRRVSAGHTHVFEKFAFGMWKRFFKLPGTYKFAMKAASIGQKPLVNNGYISAQLPLLSNWTNSRYMRAAADTTFRERWEKRKK
ncbi:LutB/LldF family L-lactate oxidation iron-sulfur protein [Sporomusa acidovorans]|uniref:Lactate utilization protein B n=1 Tax=Sporomusa acidovorans (strain ATCC 49682 / DSM 3132 / Mol) TaxID=1123286 RepID=A0ABZ3J8I2_SPOA4|nr:LutB/LldF family L-lactate oxidation iron-sulfur protein [Sporomusa acidovorans]OZC16688.1 lactate utilization protein B [Sporomusa acidovorans DSM 3132]SDE06106.1 L-lactate dehydrogenase complex protein LldF [Sporomusa acidovorans]